jgi:hypothetical protein
MTVANINIKYKGLTGLLNDLTIDDGQTMAQLRSAIIGDEGLSSSYYSRVSIHKNGTVKDSTDDSATTLASAGIVAGDIITVACERAQASRQLSQEMQLDIAQLKRKAGGDTSKPYYRSLNDYDNTELPTQYEGDSLLDNPNSQGLLLGRPWSADGITLSSLVTWLDPTFAVSGSTIIDQSASENNATLVNATHDAANDYFVFNGSNAYIRSANLYSDIGNPDTFSAGAWVYPTAAGVVLQIAGTPTPETSYYFSALEFIGAGSPVPNFGLWNGAGTTKDTGSALSYNTWYHMVITYNGTTLKGYINGAEVASASVTFDSPHDDGLTVHHLLWGAGSGTNMGDGTYYNGNMAEIRTYSDALTAPEVLANYNATKSRYGY